MAFYTFEWKTPAGTWLADLEIARVDYEVDDSGGDPELVVFGLWVEWGEQKEDLLDMPDDNNSELISLLAGEIKSTIESDHSWCNDRLMEGGWRFDGKGPGDPGGRWSCAMREAAE